MADTGFNHGDLTHLTYDSGGPQPIDGISVADNGTLTSDAVSLDNKYGRVYSVVTYNTTGVTDGNITVRILESDFDPDAEGYNGAAGDVIFVAAVIDQQEATTNRANFLVLASDFPRHKITVFNESGQEAALTINYVDITIPAAS